MKKLLIKIKIMKTFKDLEFKPHMIGNGLQARIKFYNLRGVSVVKFDGSHGYPDLWELAVLDKNGRLDYETPITDNILGYLTDDDVTEIMQKVEALE